MWQIFMYAFGEWRNYHAIYRKQHHAEAMANRLRHDPIYEKVVVVPVPCIDGTYFPGRVPEALKNNDSSAT